MKVLVGISTSDLTALDHSALTISSSAGFNVRCEGVIGSPVPAGQLFHLEIDKSKDKSDALSFRYDGKKERYITSRKLILEPLKGSSFTFNSITREYAKGRSNPVYQGEFEAFVHNGKLRIGLRIELDQYLKGVLQSEIPASYPIEAIKAQAVAARTYALRPRINHMKHDSINVCDSYLCCQYFGGTKAAASANHLNAIAQTAGQVLTYNSEPILALFSSNAGGHTENFENCFSDPDTKEFPPPALPYLKGVWETKLGKAPRALDLSNESDLRSFYAMTPFTEDKASSHYRWKVHLTANQLESNLHHNVSKLLKNPDTAPYLVAPKSAEFGHIGGFKALKRGVAGTIIELGVSTSSGDWIIKKELVIRDFFSVGQAGLKRLKSARIFFEQSKDKLGLLADLTISGTGWGHGVGMQQSGASGFAKSGLDYQSILKLYYSGVAIDKV
ncbi:MAG: SpoIID/LytB domain-containing protein [Candidatus Melainabacteria bacterium]|nr:SpoIID/LytB domain-containing protein [Candidatus Melainabacteria bacterium]